MNEQQKAAQETKFFEWYNQMKAIAEEHNQEINKMLNVRQIFDIAYTFGYTASLKDRIAEMDVQTIKVFDEDNKEITECYCNPCNDVNCDCRVQRCDYCLANN